MTEEFRLGTTQITVPAKADPFVKELYRLIVKHQFPIKALAHKSGVARNTIDGWRRHSAPRAQDLEACFNVLGYRLAPIPIEREAA